MNNDYPVKLTCLGEFTIGFVKTHCCGNKDLVVNILGHYVVNHEANTNLNIKMRLFQ
jgi:hypothetical protein